MTRAALYELVDTIQDDEVGFIYSVLSRLIKNKGLEFEYDLPLPDELEIIAESERAKAAGEELYSLDDCR